MTFRKSELDQSIVKRLATEYGISIALAAIIYRRGLHTLGDDIKYYFDNALAQQNSPFLFKDMSKALARIARAARDNENVLVFGDRDADGTTATTIMHHGLLLHNIRSRWRVPCADEPYGLTENVIHYCEKEHISLIITVDCGISNLEAITLANSKQIDTIVFDHHNPQHALPPAYAIINPKLTDSGYPVDFISGCVLAYKFHIALQFSQCAQYQKSLCLLQCQAHGEEIRISGIVQNNLICTRSFQYTWQRTGAPDPADLRALIATLQQSELFVTDHQQWKMLLAYGVDALQSKQVTLIHAGAATAGAEQSNAYQESEQDMLHRVLIEHLCAQHTAFNTVWEHYCVLAALSTIADMMPLKGENRTIVRAGMHRLFNGYFPGLHALLRKQALIRGDVTARMLSFSIIPLINAAGRLGAADKAVELLLEQDTERANQIADELTALNVERKSMCDSAWEHVIQDAQASFKTCQRKCVIVAHTNIVRGITGLLANKLLATFKVPCIVISLMSEQAAGSIRCNKTLKATQFLKVHADFFHEWGGHDRAGGFQIAAQDVASCIKAFERYFLNRALQSISEPLIIDAEMPRKNLDHTIFDIAHMLEPYGQEFPQLLFYTPSMCIKELKIIGRGENHAKMLLDSSYHTIPALFWNCQEYIGTTLAVNAAIDIIYNVEINSFRHQIEKRLIIIDAQISKHIK